MEVGKYGVGICDWCGEAFPKRVSWAKFCRPSHRQRRNLAKRIETAVHQIVEDRAKLEGRQP